MSESTEEILKNLNDRSKYPGPDCFPDSPVWRKYIWKLPSFSEMDQFWARFSLKDGRIFQSYGKNGRSFGRIGWNIV